MISLSEDKFPLRHGQRLCSHRAPQEEAKAWCDNIDLVDWAFPVILGLGAGFHIQEFKQRHPDKKFFVLDLNCDLGKPSFEDCTRFFTVRNMAVEIDHFLLSSPDDRVYQVIEFRPAWAGAEKDFQFMAQYILGRHIEGLKYNQIIKAQINLYGQIKNLPNHLEVSFGSLLQVSGDPMSEIQRQKELIRSLIK